MSGHGQQWHPVSCGIREGFTHACGGSIALIRVVRIGDALGVGQQPTEETRRVGAPN